MDKKGYHIAFEASMLYSEEYIGLPNRDEYNAAISHVNDLIRSAYILFVANHFAPCLFLTITIFEEIAKIKSGYNRHHLQLTQNEVKRSKDPLFNHAKKHKIAVDPIYLIGDRIAKSIGKQRAEEIFLKYETGEYSSLRERSLYFYRDKNKLHIPSNEIDVTLAAEHLLIGIEIFCDEFWGMTGEASMICDTTNPLYSYVEIKLKQFRDE